MKRILTFSTLTLLTVAFTGNLANAQSIRWTNPNGSGQVTPTIPTITGGPWTLGNGPVVPGSDSKGTATQTLNYCGSNAVVGTAASTTRNTGTQLFQPYYFPFIVGQGKNLQGYFDYRPKDTNEAVVAANSTDGGNTWTFQQEALELNPGLCPPANSNNASTYPPSTTANPYPNQSAVLISNASGSPGATDDGQGHPYVSNIKGVNYLYTIDRAVNPNDNSVDNLGLVVHVLSSGTVAQPLTGVELTSPDSTDTTTTSDGNKGTRTVGLYNPDGIISEVPGTYPRIILYLSKILNGDNTVVSYPDSTVATNYPASQQCVSPTVGPQKGKAVNHDISIPRLAITTDGINFKDLGQITGLNNPTTISYTGTRWIAPTGTLIKIGSNHFGLFFSGGNCVDADSDSFHYIGYAESTNLLNWTVINDINSPIASIAQIAANGSTLPDGTTFNTSIPANTPLVSNQPWFAGRIYAPNAILTDPTNNLYTVFAAGYTTKSPSGNYSSYRTITQFVLKRTGI